MINFLRKKLFLSSIQAPFPKVSLLWVGGYPSHYMSEFHYRMQKLYPSVFFMYLSFKRNTKASAHEVLNMPDRFIYSRSLLTWLWCWNNLEEINPEAILLCGTYPREIFVAYIWAILRNRSIYYLSDNNSLDSKNLKRNWLNRTLMKFMLCNINKVMCIGTRNAEFYMKYLSKEKLSKNLIFFPLPHDNIKFEKNYHKPNKKFTFLVFGRLEKVKCVDKIIDAYSKLDNNSKQISRLLIAGDGENRYQLESQVRSLGIKDYVEFRGTIPSDMAPNVFSEANALIIASTDEPWGLVVNEALSSGIPVIGPFWIGSFIDLVTNEETGIITTDNTPTQLAIAMHNLLNNPFRASKIGNMGKLKIQEKGWTINKSLQVIGELDELKNFK